MAGAIRPEDRPVSPFLTVWRWHITMAASILHRVAGIALYGGAVLFAVWLMVIAAGPEAYAPIGMLLASPVGQIALYLLVAALAFHLANGIRHFVFDTGAGLKPADADLTAWFAILFAFAAPIGLWALLNFGGLHR
jgi:succinate dehydrogenase / fumarate reductase, cytochrome b subunit